MEIFRAKIVDVSKNTLTVESSGTSDKVEALLDMLRPFGIKEIVRTGTIAIERGGRVIGSENGE
jgi:acetolactate synthase-1/3 small subunit